MVKAPGSSSAAAAAAATVKASKRAGGEVEWGGDGAVGPQVVRAFVNYFSKEVRGRGWGKGERFLLLLYRMGIVGKIDFHL